MIIKTLAWLVYRYQRAKVQLRQQYQKRLYDGANTSTLHKRPGTSRSGDGVMNQARGRVRDWARHLDENHDLVIGILDELVNNTVGAGIDIEPATKTKGGKLNAKLNRDIAKAFKRWAKSADVSGELHFKKMQRQICRSWLRDGELFIEHMRENANTVPYAVKLYESEYVPFALTGDNIIHGVEKNPNGRPLAYYFHREHPGDSFDFGTQTIADYIRKSADTVTHLKFTRRIGQTRGVSVLHGVLHRLDDIKDYEESERIAARVNASVTAMITKPLEIDEANITGERFIEMQPGMIMDGLGPGERIEMVKGERPNTGLIDYRNSQMRAVAAGTGTKYSTISRNYLGNYSSQRQELVESYPGYDSLRNDFVAIALQPIYERFIDFLIASGGVMLSNRVDLESLYDFEPGFPPRPWIQPKEETETDILQIENRLKSRAQIIRERGGNPEVINEQIKMEQQADAAEREKQQQQQQQPPVADQADQQGNGDDDGGQQQAEAA